MYCTRIANKPAFTFATEGSEDSVNVASASVVVIAREVLRLLPRFDPETLGCTVVSVTPRSPTIFADTLTVVESIVPTSVDEGVIPTRSRNFVVTLVPSPNEQVAYSESVVFA